MKLLKKLFIVGLILAPALVIISCNNKEPEAPVKHDTQPKFEKEGELLFLKPDGSSIVKVNIEIADNDAERQMGLMNRSFMNNSQAMLFIFDVEEPQAFWMKNTIIPLDIIYVNSNKEIVSIAANTEPYSEKSLPSGRPAIYVVEVNGGFCDQYGIAAGSKISFTRNP
ncbi:MAG: DUF192 domain-containing protein [Chitinophagales bacterium]|jgi:hypothetical protein|nr:DUF192 domain-containing protein [Bacteroidota bacterium]MBK7568517.1 DUF192 domain-containing protein [Bacteroidota bacterium]MBP8915338.1 DUF192 domain-containing protein [Chitinophagales bacterium]MBP9220555.1 DUF192 domain-containing protein [Chitinophagales bacterium]MBP9794827.1 DUF192 domain-containing protein [Chitinophagales bacterium]